MNKENANGAEAEKKAPCEESAAGAADEKKTEPSETGRSGTEKEASEPAAPGSDETEKAAETPKETPEAREYAELMDRYVRMAAEYDNYRKRSVREREALYGDATAATAAVFLPVLDNLERAAAQPTADAAYKKGVEMTLKILYDCLTRLKIEEIPAAGQAFDPELHHAVLHVEDGSLGENTVVEVMQKGFTLDGRVIRHAMVKVAN